LRMISRGVIPGMSTHAAVALAGTLEVCFGILVLLLWKSRWPLWVTILLMMLALVGVAVSSPEYLTGAFNPVTLNLSVAALAAIALLAHEHIPRASTCLRQPPAEAS
jgi:peptidoglycan/LPS O-acetylase OafA/YrhL